MELVNVNGLVIFGSGSEWFWTMAQFIVVVITLIAIYLQLRSQQSAALHDQIRAWDDEWNGEAFTLQRLKLLVDLDSRPITSGLPPSSSPITDFFGRLGLLVVGGHLPAAKVAPALRAPIGRYWSLLEPWIVEERARRGYNLLEYFERLEAAMRKIDRQRFGRELSFPVDRSAGLGEPIEQLRSHLQMLIDARSGVLPAVHWRPSPAENSSR